MKRYFFLALMMGLAANAAWAASVQGPADVGRIDQRKELQPPEPEVEPPAEPAQLFPNVAPPEGSKAVTLTLREIHITGMTVFTDGDVKDICAPYIGRTITLDTVWLIAGELTERYRNAGYFLTRVVVPQQEIKDGVITLHVVEGYVGEVKLDGPLADNGIVKDWIDELKAAHPISAKKIESVLLHLDDLPGVSFRAVLEPMTEGEEGAVRLVLVPKNIPITTGEIDFDNYGSRFLGPYETQAQLQTVLIPMQRTTLSWFSSLPWDEVKYGGISHEIPLFARATLELYGSYTKGAPGYTLEPENIRSNSATIGTAFDYSIIRQRQENLTTRLAVEGRKSDADILGTPLTRDNIRAARFGMNYQLADNWRGQNTVNGTLSQGLNILGASKAGQLNISRADARPDFTKFNLDASRLQGIVQNWDVLVATSSQIASGPLYSSEQFGYGGQAFGRAYDNSEITGDDGFAASGELRYSGIAPFDHLQTVPYGFYDFGMIWNLGSGQTNYHSSGSSAGAGFHLLSDFGLSGNFGLALPLTRRIANPVYGNGLNPRVFARISYGF